MRPRDPQTPLGDRPAAGHARRRSKRVVAGLLYVAFLVLLVELGAIAALSLEERKIVSGNQLRERMARAARGKETGLPRADTDFPTSLHPYVGFMARTGTAESEMGVSLNQPAFYAPTSPIFSDDPDTVVVGIVGGSVAELFARFEGALALAKGLERLPRFAGKKIRFALLAWGGCKQPQQLMALNYLFALGGRLDLLIALDGLNEIALHETENRNQRISPLYPRGWFFIAYRHKVLLKLGRLEELRGERRELAQRASTSPLSASWAFRAIWKWRDERLAAAIRSAQDELRDLEPYFDPDAPRDFILSGPESRAETFEERLDELARIWLNASIQLDRVCRANGVEFYQFLQPNQYVAGSKPLSEEERRNAYSPTSHPYAPCVIAGYPKLQQAADALEQEGVRFADLTGVFADVEETVYVDDCCHINGYGNVLLANAMVRFIARAQE